MLRFVAARCACWIACVAAAINFTSVGEAAEIRRDASAFLGRYCNDCHADGASEGGLAFETLTDDLGDKANFARWERLFDRVATGEMPPADADPLPSTGERDRFAARLKPTLVAAHAASKGTVLRRLNRREYSNTLNDIFGTNVKLEGRLPEDGRSHEFDNVGEALGISMVHLERFLDAVNSVLDTAIAKTVDAPESKNIVASYKGTREGDRFIGERWKELSDGAVVRFSGGGYPSGMMRSAGIRESGRYRVRIEGYAYQSDIPVTFSVNRTSFKPGAEKPIYGFFSFDPGEPGDKPQSVEFEQWIEGNAMLQIEPYGINDPDRYKRTSIDKYDGPGLAIVRVTIDGPITGAFPSRGHKLVFDGFQRSEVPPSNPQVRNKPWYVPKFEVTARSESRAVVATIERVAELAFRRPASREEIQRYSELLAREKQVDGSLEEALRTTVAAIFCSPRFLYLNEPAGRLDDYAVAARLSYFLARTSPDDELRQLAEAGRLAGDPRELRRQVDRLLSDDRFERFVTDFTDSWLDLREMDFTAPDSKLFPEFDPYLRWSMPLETQAFVRHLIEQNRPVRDLVAPDYAMLNSRLAAHYGLDEVTGSAIRPVAQGRDSLRGGLLAQASILKVTANGTNSSPVTRGAWVMERIFGETPPPPPPGVPGVEPDIRGASTLRELLDKHRDQPNCVACHTKIDPPGFALESFNPIGGHRDRYRSLGAGDRSDVEINGRRVQYRLGPDVDSSGQFPDGRAFASFREFRDTLADEQKMLAHTLAEKLLTFATGREMGFSDRDAIDEIVQQVRRDGYRVRDLLYAVVTSEIFLNK